MASEEIIHVASVIHAASNGDVILVCGGTPAPVTRISVSSVILSNGSSTFRAMLSPRFKEGQELASASTPVEVSLPDDDAQAMTLLCQILHLRNRSMGMPLAPNMLLRLVVLADKYDCTEAIMWAVNISTNSALMHKKDTTRAILLAIAYLMRDEKLGAHVAMELVMDTKGIIGVGESVDVELPDVVLRAFAYLQMRRNEIMVGLDKLIEVAVMDRLKSSCKIKDCGYWDVRTAEVLRRLSQELLWPVGQWCKNGPIRDVLWRMKSVADKLDPPSPVHKCDGKGPLSFDLVFAPFVEEAKRIEGEFAFHGVARLCFTCFEAGRVEVQRGHRLCNRHPAPVLAPVPWPLW